MDMAINFSLEFITYTKCGFRLVLYNIEKKERNLWITGRHGMQGCIFRPKKYNGKSNQSDGP